MCIRDRVYTGQIFLTSLTLKNNLHLKEENIVTFFMKRLYSAKLPSMSELISPILPCARLSDRFSRATLTPPVQLDKHDVCT